MTRSIPGLALIAGLMAIAAVPLSRSSAPRDVEQAVSSAPSIDTAIVARSIVSVSVMIAPHFAIAHRAVMVLDSVRMVAVHLDSAPERPIALRFLAADSSARLTMPPNSRSTTAATRWRASTRKQFARRLT